MLAFGEKVEGYDSLMFNEREVRAAAGIVFLFAFMAFMSGFLTGNNEPTKLMVSVFLFDFFIRIFISPKYAPSMVVGRWIVNNQKPEYTDAAPKKWAWSFGFILAATMFYLVVLNDIRGPINILTCALCLGLLFFEAVFGICAGCKIYNLVHNKKVKHCPGEVCDLSRVKAPIQYLNGLQKIVFILAFIALFYLTFGDIIKFLIFGE
ncbi:hypothetical protein [uncultured Gammaproteobacteria bacterium]|uniref:DUF4395 domain-containing protein n=1 Tax=Bathymodiolus heckerae thiotrophic gill symbiont TaxID=1052212 RepID=UPI0010AFDFC0|nr:DUF4395 domain-containing protein [Bathymodiolus heckerae thiotrophic gill symbiont]CAC9529450.1 hypothetical protein [uncultured Gammaproteobacteria bacterium]CAC9598050.1 hypothetical protein [uncultured Gammaproteobacteria bacterium]CAC9950757.1 hypothetical protein [uncultured Gammaproteobacteria bacterium]CAC9964172.1 hypothetical protein [uncultured Gammaproteobacteria bacterium]SHN91121.1 hypothetical protein BHECKSOX_1399 [Bathymodiolus heckerae thiotrophic gill symbiont]